MTKIVKSFDSNLHGSLQSMICQQVVLSGDAEWPKVADAVIEALARIGAKLRESFAVFLLLFGLRHAGSFLLAFGGPPPALPKRNDLPWEHLSG
jgi:hypothetical protein